MAADDRGAKMAAELPKEVHVGAFLNGRIKVQIKSKIFRCVEVAFISYHRKVEGEGGVDRLRDIRSRGLEREGSKRGRC